MCMLQEALHERRFFVRPLMSERACTATGSSVLLARVLYRSPSVFVFLVSVIRSQESRKNSSPTSCILLQREVCVVLLTHRFASKVRMRCQKCMTVLIRRFCSRARLCLAQNSETDNLLSLNHVARPLQGRSTNLAQRERRSFAQIRSRMEEITGSSDLCVNLYLQVFTPNTCQHVTEGTRMTASNS